jgi:hypothetical protein
MKGFEIKTSEHRQRQDHKDPAESNNHPRLLKQDLKVAAEKSCQNTESRVSKRGRKHIDQR